MMFSFPIRVYWEDTDAGGVVYHASYLCFLERARTEWLRAEGVAQGEMRNRDGVVMAVRSMQLDFLKPARLDDVLHASVELLERRGASFVVRQELFRETTCLLRAQVGIACLHAANFKPRPLPSWLVLAPSTGAMS